MYLVNVGSATGPVRYLVFVATAAVHRRAAPDRAGVEAVAVAMAVDGAGTIAGAGGQAVGLAADSGCAVACWRSFAWVRSRLK